MDSISIILIAQDNAFELGLSLDAIHESHQALQSLGLGKRLRGIVVIDYASHPSEADLISKRIVKEQSLGWTEIIYERRVISLTPTFAFERGIQLQNKLSVDQKEQKSNDWLLFVKPGIQLDGHFLRKFIISPPQEVETQSTKKNPMGARLFGEFIVCQEQNPAARAQKLIQSTQNIFQKYSIKQLFSIKVKSDFLCFQKYDSRFLSLDWYSRYPKFSINEVIRDALKSRGWKVQLRSDLKYKVFRTEIPYLVGEKNAVG